MSTVNTAISGNHNHNHNDSETQDLKYMGFWIYLMTDLLIFGSLFATFAVLRNGSFGNITHQELAGDSMHTAILETIFLLLSSFTSGLAVLFLKTKKVKPVLSMLVVTLVFGLGFLYLEVSEFVHLFSEGHSFTASAFLSSFFGLIGTHGLHIIIGCLWIVGLIIQLALREINEVTERKVKVFSLYWHFLEIVWIFIFTFVYLYGVIK